MARRSPATAALAILFTVGVFALAPSRAQYLGGTVSVKLLSEGIFDTGGSATSIGFISRDKKDGNLTVLYASVIELEYGQKAGHRVTSGTKPGDHVLTISFKDADGKDQAAVFELGKDIIGPTLDVLKNRTGKPLACQNRKAAGEYKFCTSIGVE